MIHTVKTYNRNAARYTTINTAIKDWFQFANTPQVVKPQDLSSALSVGGELRMKATAQVDKDYHDDGTKSLSIYIRVAYLYKGTEIEMWNYDFFAEGYNFDECYTALQNQLWFNMDDMLLQQRAIDRTLKSLGYGGMLV
jgi:hypothetical protein